MPSLKKVLRSSKKSDCALNNLSAIFIGIANYAEDEQFSLPGPASPPKPIWLKSNLEGNGVEARGYRSGLQYFLYPYLVENQTSEKVQVGQMQCPENMELELEWNTEKRASYFLAKNLDHKEQVMEVYSENTLSHPSRFKKVLSKSPFGEVEFYRSSDGYHRSGFEPMKLFQLNPSGDQGIYDAFWDKGKAWIYPRSPVHLNGSINLMFLDGHLEDYMPDLNEMKKNNKMIQQIL